MIDLGNFALVAAWLLSLYAFTAGVYAVARGRSSLKQSAANSVIACAGLSIFALVMLTFHFINHDYRYAYVWQNSNNEMPPYYLAAAVWGGMDGSLLLWVALLGGLAALALLRIGPKIRHLVPWLTVVFSGVLLFFLSVLVFAANPFRLIPGGAVPADGFGLNPLLQNPSMLVHPVLLYLGFTGLTVPFAFCFAALLSGNLDTQWIKLTRRWTLIGWAFLTAGIILGGNWAYIELGWGGFWGWDPVENASFLPWLTATAFLHSVMVQERKGMLKVWNVSLCAATYILTIIGTAITRSGIVQSVHAFAESDVGWMFLFFIVLLVLLTAGAIAYRWSELRPESSFESYLSKEVAFLFNNLLLVLICIVTLLGVMFPFISEAVWGQKQVVGPPFFNMVNIPLFLGLVFLMGVGPLIAWRRSSKKSLALIFAKPLLTGVAVLGLCLLLDSERILAAVSFGLAAFVLLTILGEFRRALQVQKALVTSKGNPAANLLRVVRRKPERYGAYLVHLGVVIAVISITASMAYKLERDFVLEQGQRYEVGRYALELSSIQLKNYSNYRASQAEVKVFERSSGSFLGYLRPEKRFYPSNQQETTEVDIRMRPLEDLYLALSGLDAGGSAEPSVAELKGVFKVFINPLQCWLWVGSFIMFLGTIVLLRSAARAPAYETSVETESVKARA